MLAGLSGMAAQRIEKFENSLLGPINKSLAEFRELQALPSNTFGLIGRV